VEAAGTHGIRLLLTSHVSVTKDGNILEGAKIDAFMCPSSEHITDRIDARVGDEPGPEL
jgi:hypothetical protein